MCQTIEYEKLLLPDSNILFLHYNQLLSPDKASLLIQEFDVYKMLTGLKQRKGSTCRF